MSVCDAGGVNGLSQDKISLEERIYEVHRNILGYPLTKEVGVAYAVLITLSIIFHIITGGK